MLDTRNIQYAKIGGRDFPLFWMVQSTFTYGKVRGLKTVQEIDNDIRELTKLFSFKNGDPVDIEAFERLIDLIFTALMTGAKAKGQELEITKEELFELIGTEEIQDLTIKAVSVWLDAQVKVKDPEVKKKK